MTSVKGDFNYQMNTVVSPVDTSQHLFPTTPVIAQRLMDKVAMEARIRTTYVFTICICHTQCPALDSKDCIFCDELIKYGTLASVERTASCPH